QSLAGGYRTHTLAAIRAEVGVVLDDLAAVVAIHGYASSWSRIRFWPGKSSQAVPTFQGFRVSRLPGFCGGVELLGLFDGRRVSSPERVPSNVFERCRREASRSSLRSRPDISESQGRVSAAGRTFHRHRDWLFAGFLSRAAALARPVRKRPPHRSSLFAR